MMRLFENKSVKYSGLATVLNASGRVAENHLRKEKTNEIRTSDISHYGRIGGSPIYRGLRWVVRIPTVN